MLKANVGTVKTLLLAAHNIGREARTCGFLKEPPATEDLNIYDKLVNNSDLRDATWKLYRDGHYATAVLEAFKLVNNLVKQKSGLGSDGSGLMKQAFSLNNPTLKLSDLKTQSKKDQQLGYMDVFAGCMTGIRNPRAHEYKYHDEPDDALKMLAWADHLIKLVNGSTRTRARKSATGKP